MTDEDYVPFIENVSREDIVSGMHTRISDNNVLIQITNIDRSFAIPKKKFSKTYRFKFNDEITIKYGSAISDTQAREIAEILIKAEENKADVIVQCEAGYSRSGAIVEAGLQLGFRDMGRTRIPNRMVYFLVHDYISKYLELNAS